MTRETIGNGLIPFSRDSEAGMTWQQFIDRASELRNKLRSMYDESPVERQEYYREVCRGGLNFGKTVKWVADYSAHPEALEAVASALEAIAGWPNAGSMAWEIRRFIKFSSTDGYNNVPDVMRFGELIKKIGNDDPTNRNKFRMDMDFFYWDSGWGVDGEATDEEILQAHCRNVTGVIKELEGFAHPEIIDVEQGLTKEEITVREREEEEQYWKGFLADAKSFKRPSLFDILDREELINRPYHKILAYPAEIAEIADGRWINCQYEDPADAMTHYYRELPYMAAGRADKNWFPSPLPADYTDFYSAKFEKRLKRTLEQKPWLIDFSVKWQDVLQRSFVGGNRQTSHAGEVELVYKNPRYNPRKDSFLNHEYELRTLESEEERLFLESAVSIQSLANQQPAVRPPEDSNSLAFSGWKEAYRFRLADGRNFDVFLKHEYGSIYWEGKLVIVSHDGPEPLFQYAKQELRSGATLTPEV